MKYEITLKCLANEVPKVVNIEADGFSVNSTNDNLYLEADDKWIAVFRDWNYIKEIYYI